MKHDAPDTIKLRVDIISDAVLGYFGWNFIAGSCCCLPRERRYFVFFIESISCSSPHLSACNTEDKSEIWLDGHSKILFRKYKERAMAEHVTS